MLKLALARRALRSQAARIESLNTPLDECNNEVEW
jgi:hypothetical protein